MVVRIALYVGFVFFAAPFEMLMDWWAGLVASNSEAWLKPIAQAAVYLYAFTLAVETLFRLEVRHEIFEEKPWTRLLQVAAWLVVVMFALDYLGVLRPAISQGGDALSAGPRQSAAAFVALTISLLSYYACEATSRPELAR